MEIGKESDRENDDDDHIRGAKDLPGMFAIQLQHIPVELCNIFRTSIPVKIKITKEGAFIKALEDFIRKIVMTDGQSMPHNVLNGPDTEIAIDSLQYFPCPVSTLGCTRKQITIEHRLDLHMPDQQFDGFTRRKVLDAKGHDAIDDASLEPESPAMEYEFQGNEDNAKKKVGDREDWADEAIVPSRLFFIEYLVDVVGHVGEMLYGVSIHVGYYLGLQRVS